MSPGRSKVRLWIKTRRSAAIAAPLVALLANACERGRQLSPDELGAGGADAMTPIHTGAGGTVGKGGASGSGGQPAANDGGSVDRPDTADAGVADYPTVMDAGSEEHPSGIDTGTDRPPPPCGDVDQPCCATGTICIGGLACASNAKCAPCGARGQQCCDGSCIGPADSCISGVCS